jgi:hypothetical protein
MWAAGDSRAESEGDRVSRGSAGRALLQKAWLPLVTVIALALGAVCMLVYVDLDGHPHQVDIPSLPWSHTETTTLTVVSGSISAQVHGGQVGCRMLVNGVVRDEQSATRDDADVTCRVKSA